MTIKQKILGLVPKNLELAARYQYNRALGRLEEEMKLVDSLSTRKRRFIDIGANIGLYSYHFAARFKDVEAFEPIPHCAAIIAASQLRNVRLHQVALSNNIGEATLNIPVADGSDATALASLSNEFNQGRSISVGVRTLDSFEFTEVDLIKIDVEGHEPQVLEGGLETIVRESPILLIEIEQRHHPAEGIQKIFDRIVALGYSGEFYWKGRIMPLAQFSVDQHQRKVDPHSPLYVNNFIFRPDANRR